MHGSLRGVKRVVVLCAIAAIAAIAVSSLAAPSVARADAAPNQAAMADALFRSAKDRMAGGDYAVACAELRESQNLDPQVGTALNLAYCYEQLGQTATAWSAWLKAAAAATAKGETERADVASVRAALLQSRLLHLTIAVKPQPAASKMQLAVDRAPLPSSQWGVPVAQDPGEHEVLATADGFRPWRLTCTVANGSEPTVVVPELEAIAPAGGAEVTRRAPSVWTSVAWATGAVGVAALGVAGGFGIAALVNESASNEAGRCTPSGCDPVQADERRRAQHDARIAGWTAGAGGVVVGASVITYFVARRSQKARSGAWTTSVIPSTRGASMVFSGSW